MSSYPLAGYAGMLLNSVRMRAYLQAMAQTIRPGCSVLDLGAGFGFFALAACRMGARRVYAIEPAESIELLPVLARANGFGEQIVAYRELSTKVSLPERVDVIVSDIRGTLPMLGGSLRAVADAHKRLLAPTGVLMPRRDRLLVAPVEDRENYVKRVSPWSVPASEHPATRGLKLGDIEKLLAQQWTSRTITAQSLLGTPRQWAEVDYYDLRSTNVEGSTELEIEAAGTLHGLCVWFDAEVIEGIRYSTGPGEPPTVYGTGFMPLEQPAEVRPGDVLRVSISAHEIGDDYTFRWRSELVRGGHSQWSYDQSEFRGQLLSLDRLKRRVPTHVPTLKPDAEIARVVLTLAAGNHSMGEIARALCERFAARFETEARALDYAASLLDRLND